MPICAFCDLSGQGNINFTNGRNGEPRFRPLPARRLDVAMTPAEQMASSGICLKAIRAGSVKTHNLRVAEVIGLTAGDVHLDEEVPFVRLSEHPWPRLKTAESERDVPLVGATLWGLKRAVECSDGGLLFPRYCTLEGNKANYASSALNKWLRSYVPEGCVVHSFRHSMRDRLRAVQCPSEIIDQIGGWQTTGVGQGYGQGHSLTVMHGWMKKLTTKVQES